MKRPTPRFLVLTFLLVALLAMLFLTVAAQGAEVVGRFAKLEPVHDIVVYGGSSGTAIAAGLAIDTNVSVQSVSCAALHEISGRRSRSWMLPGFPRPNRPPARSSRNHEIPGSVLLS